MTTRYGMLRGKTLAEIITALNSMKTPVTQLEFEAKFGLYTKTGFQSSVTFRRFNALKKVLQSKLKSTQQLITDYKTNAGIRKQSIVSKGEEDRELWQRKTTLKDFSDPALRDYNIRISINSEKPIKPIVNFVHDLIRIKNRTTFFYGEFLKIDMSVVTTIYAEKGKKRKNPKEEGCGDNPEESYEVEVELLEWSSNIVSKFANFNKLLHFIFTQLYETALLYTVNEKRDLAQQINNILGEKHGTFLRFGMVAQARNLKFRDMVWGGLIGNEFRKDGKMVQNRYSITHKADGLRKFLVVDKSGIWLIFPPDEFNLVYRFTSLDQDHSLNGLVLDGELVPNDKAHRKSENVAHKIRKDIVGLDFFDTKDRKNLRLIPGATYWYLVFDALAIDGNKDVQFQPHSERMKWAYRATNRFLDIQDNKRLVINFKSFKQITSPDMFYTLMQRMFVEKDLLPYAEDGFIFMSEMAPYNPIKQAEQRSKRTLKLHERSLVRQSDICKWKPVERLTIDFCIKKKGDGTIDLMVLNGRKKVPFTGTPFNPFDVESMVDSDHLLLKKYPTGSIIEFQWDFLRERFTPLFARPDKRNPNRLDIANDDWDDIHNPITQNVLEGRNFTLMRKYHNRIKHQLFKSLTSFRTVAGQPKKRYLLDIGSGRGGDVSKWRNFDKIVAVEPNGDHIVELERRLELWGLRDRVEIVQTGGEDTRKITAAVKRFVGQRVHTVSMMLSMTFFWKNKKRLQKLVGTIDANLYDHGTIVFMVMDGDTVEEVFDPYFLSFKTKKLVFHQTEEDKGYATLELQPQDEVERGQGRKAYVYIQDSIVGTKNKGTKDKGLKDKGTKDKGTKRRGSPPAQVQFKDIPVILSEKRVETVLFTEIPVIQVETRKTKEEKVVVQEEYLVHLTDFETLLSKRRSITEKRIYRADREPFLTDAEKRFSMMYSFGSYTTAKTTAKGVGPLGFAYAQWEIVEDIASTITDTYERAEAILPAYYFYLAQLTGEFGRPFIEVVSTETKEEILPFNNNFISDLVSRKIEQRQAEELVKYVYDTIQDTIQSFVLDSPLPAKIHEEDIDEPLEGLIRIKDFYFYIHPERLTYFKEMVKSLPQSQQLEKIVAMLLDHFTSFHRGIQYGSLEMLPRAFYQRIAKKWKENLILEANVTPLTTQMPFLEGGYAQEEFTSYFQRDKLFGSMGRFEDLDMFGPKGDLYTTVVYFHPGGTLETEEVGFLILDLLRETPADRMFRVLYFIDDEDLSVCEHLKEELESSVFLVYTKTLMLHFPYHVYILESTHSPSDTYDTLFAKLAEEFAEMEEKWEEPIPHPIEQFLKSLQPHEGFSIFYH